MRLLLFDIILATVHLASDLFLVYSYFFLTHDPWWGGVTIVAICLPGLLGKNKSFTFNYKQEDEILVNGEESWMMVRVVVMKVMKDFGRK